MNLQQTTPEKLRPGKIGERDLRAYFNLQNTFLQSIKSAWDMSRIAYGSAIDIQSEPQKEHSTETNGANVSTAQAPEVQKASAPAEVVIQKVPEEVATVLAVSAVNATEASENASNLDLAVIRDNIKNSFEPTPAPLESEKSQTDYELAA